jgi:integrase
MAGDQGRLPKGVHVEKEDDHGSPVHYYVRITESYSGKRRYYGGFSDPYEAALFANRCREANQEKRPHPPHGAMNGDPIAAHLGDDCTPIHVALENWLAWKRYDRISADQFETYERWVNRLKEHPLIVDLQFAERLSLDAVSDIVEGYANQKYSKNQCKIVVSILRNSLDYTVYQGRLNHNPIQGGWDALWLRSTWEESEAAPAVGIHPVASISAELSPGSRAPLWVCFLGMLRISEAFGLAVGDFNEKRPSLRVGRIGGGGISEWVYDESGERIGTETVFFAERTKSVTSARTIIIPRWLADLLKAYIRRYHGEKPNKSAQLFRLDQSKEVNRALSATWRKEFQRVAASVMQYTSVEGLPVYHASGDPVLGSPPTSTARREGNALVLDEEGDIELDPKYIGPEPLLPYEPGWIPHPHWLRGCCAAITAKVLHVPGPLISDYLGHARPKHEDGTAAATHIYTGRRVDASESRVATELDRWIVESLELSPQDVLGAAPSDPRVGSETVRRSELLSIKQVANEVGLTPSGVYAAAANGRLMPVPGLKQKMFAPEAVAAFKENYSPVPTGWVATRDVRAELGGLTEASFARAARHLELDGERTLIGKHSYISPEGRDRLILYVDEFSENLGDLSAELAVSVTESLRELDGPYYRVIEDESGKRVTSEAAGVLRVRFGEYREWWRVRELSEDLGVSGYELYKRIAAGEFESARVGELLLVRRT